MTPLDARQNADVVRLLEREKGFVEVLQRIIKTYLDAAEFTGLHEGRLYRIAVAAKDMARMASDAVNDQ